MNPEELQSFVSEHLYYILIFNVVLSLIFGVIALVTGVRRGKRSLGIVGLIVSVIVGIPSWVLGLVSAAVFVTIILVKTSKSRSKELTDQNNS